jgi:hypothetical protein
MDVRHVHLRIAGRADRADGLALGGSVAVADQDRAQMEKRDRVAVGRPDRDRAPVRRQPAGEGDPPSGRRPNGRALIAADVDARMAVLAVLRPAEVEATQHRSVRRPRPCQGGRRRQERQCEH